MKFKGSDYSRTGLSENDLRGMHIHDETHASIEGYEKLFPLLLGVVSLFSLLKPILNKCHKKLLDSQVRDLPGELPHTH